MLKTTGERIQAARKLKGLTQAALAAHLDVSQAVVSRWERNSIEPHVRWLRKIAPICECKVADLQVG